MKFVKIFSAVVCFAAMSLFTGCSDVTDPKFHTPDAESFLINTPPFLNQYYGLSEDGTFELTLNGQPDYGFSAITQYRALVSLTGKFDTEADYRVLTPTGSGTLSKMTIKDNDLAMAMCDLRGITEKSQYTDAGEQKVYFKGAAYIDGLTDAEGNNRSYVVTSNTVTLNRVQGYLALPIPGVIYVIGNYTGSWISPDAGNESQLEPYSLSESVDAIGSKVYYGTIDFQPTNADEGSIFRFYTALTGWDADSWGCAGGTDSDTPVEFPDFTSGQTLDHALAKTKDSFKFNNYTGRLDFTVDMSDSANPKVIIKALD